MQASSLSHVSPLQSSLYLNAVDLGIKGDGRTYTKFKMGILSCSSFARCKLHPSHVPSATSEPVEHATNPEPDCHLNCSSPGDAGVESHHILQHIASLRSLAQYQPPEGIPRSVASSGRPALLSQRGQRSLSLAIGPHVDRQVSASIFSIHHCIHHSLRNPSNICYRNQDDQ